MVLLLGLNFSGPTVPIKFEIDPVKMSEAFSATNYLKLLVMLAPFEGKS